MHAASVIADWYSRLRTMRAPSGIRLPTVARIGGFWAALLMASMFGVLGAMDGWLFDRMVKFPPRQALASRVAVVTYPANGNADERAALVDGLREAGAAAVVVVAAAATTVPFAQPSPAARGNQQAQAKGASPAAADATLDPDEPGSGCQPGAEIGVARDLPLKGVRGQDCLIARMGGQLGLRLPAAARISPDFSILSGTALPALRSEQAGSPALLKLIVSGRTVLVYPGPDPPVHVTPLYASDGLMPASVLHALALDGLIRQRIVRWADPPLDVVLALAVVGLLSWWLRGASHRAVVRWCVLALLLVLLLGAGMLRLAYVHLPATASLGAILAFLLNRIASRNRALTQTLLDVDHQLTGLVQRPLAVSFNPTGDAIWEHVNRFVVQLFDLQRSVMLRLPAGTFHLEPASWIDCVPGSIVENRKDYRRSPYLTAIAAGRPIRLEKPYFPAGEGLVDFLAPLVVAEHLVGFWAFSAKAASTAELDALSHEAAPYADEVAKVVFHSAQAPEGNEPGSSRRFLKLATTRSRLLGVAQLAKEQLAAYRDVFVAVGHPIAVADLFGRIQFSNLRFEEYALAISRPLLAMSVHNILTQLCGVSAVEAKRLLRQTLVQRREEVGGLPVNVKDAPIAYSLHLKPVLRHGAGLSGAMVSPFDIIGLVIELSPTVDPEVSLAEITRTTSKALRRVMAGLHSLVRITDGLPEGTGQRDLMADQLQMLLGVTGQLGKLFHASDHDARANAIDVRRLLERARQDALRDASGKSLEIVIDQVPPLSVVVREAPLRILLADLLGLLIEDANPGTSIRISTQLAPDQSWVTVQCSNVGYGLPETHVADVMKRAHADPASTAGEASTLERLAEHARELDAGLSLQLTTRIGEGFAAELRLPGARDRM